MNCVCILYFLENYHPPTTLKKLKFMPYVRWNADQFLRIAFGAYSYQKSPPEEPSTEPFYARLEKEYLGLGFCTHAAAASTS